MNKLNDLSYLTYYPSPIGILKIEFNQQSLLKVEFDDQLREVKNNCQQNFYEDPRLLAIYNLIFDQLNQYFMGKRTDFDIPLALKGSSFDLKVWKYLSSIPFGRTSSCSEIAAAIGKSTAVKAVEQANERNPISVIIPCHRVIAKSGKLTGYQGGIWRKRWLLEHENNTTNNLERKMSFV